MTDPASKPPDAIRPEVWQAYLDAPDHVVAEILGGELSLMPRPRPRHARVAGRLLVRLRGFDDPDDGDPGGWVILIEPELHLSPIDWPVVPEVSGWLRARVSDEVFETAAIAIAPDWSARCFPIARAASTA